MEQELLKTNIATILRYLAFNIKVHTTSNFVSRIANKIELNRKNFTDEEMVYIKKIYMRGPEWINHCGKTLNYKYTVVPKKNDYE